MCPCVRVTRLHTHAHTPCVCVCVQACVFTHVFVQYNIKLSLPGHSARFVSVLPHFLYFCSLPLSLSLSLSLSPSVGSIIFHSNARSFPTPLPQVPSLTPCCQFLPSFFFISTKRPLLICDVFRGLEESVSQGRPADSRLAVTEEEMREELMATIPSLHK